MVVKLVEVMAVKTADWMVDLSVGKMVALMAD